MKTMFTAAVVAAMLAAPAVAQDVRTARVGYADLDLGSASGQRVLAQRIDSAAARVCGVDPSERQLVLRRTAKLCQAEAVADSTARVSRGHSVMVAAR